jgi:alginate O-acetyltransferase complex protein AlgJ
MFNISSLRYRYTQFFVLFILCSLIYVMTQSVGPGVMNFQDNFYKRFVLIEKATQLRMKMGDRAFSVAVLGKDGWMEHTDEGNIDDFQHVRTLTNKEDIGKGLITLNQYLKSQGITLLIVVGPNKSSIYPDKLPDQIKSQPVPSRLDILTSYLEDNGLPIVDLRPALRTARQDRDVYYKTDTHWNGYGALVAYTTIINALESSYPELKPYKASDLQLVTTGPDQREIPSMMGVTTIIELSFFFTPREPFVQTLNPGDYHGYDRLSWIPDSKLPKLLMFHDSFGANYLNDYLCMNFSESNFVHLGSMSQYLTKESIQYFKPDVIIIQIVERNLQELPVYFPGFMLE